MQAARPRLNPGRMAAIQIRSSTPCSGGRGGRDPGLADSAQGMFEMPIPCLVDWSTGTYPTRQHLCRAGRCEPAHRNRVTRTDHTHERDYLALALKLATNPQKHAALREQLAANRLTQLLYNTTLFARHIEATYLEMWQHHQAGLPPAHIVVPSLHPGSLA
jgi:hypothetical protein